MMNSETRKPLLCTQLVFGEKYQYFIPFFVYSFNMFYPDYDICIVLDNQLLPDIKKSLDMVGAPIIIIDDYFKKIGFKGSVFSQAGKSLRWVMHEPVFDEYDAIYIGDIDILICPEEPGIYEQHLRHCSVLGLPYSNLLRHSEKQLSLHPRSIALRLYKEGFISTVKSCFNRTRRYDRLSGLHFIVTKEYFEKIDSLIPEYLSSIKNGRKYRHHENGISNESLLYDLTFDAGIPLPRTSTIEDDMLSILSCNPENYDNVSFRPHHGIHLGIFRDSDLTAVASIIHSPTYEKYFRSYADIMRNDDLFSKLLDKSSDYVKQIFSRLDSYIGENFGL